MVKQDKKLRLDAKGLKNRGNFCFFNSVIQCVLSIPDFTTYFSNNSPGEISDQLSKFIDYYKNFTDLSPDKFIEQLRHKIKLLNGKQQDSHEFLISFLNLLLEELPNLNKQKDWSINDLEQLKNKNYVAKTFYGLMQTIVTCQNCKTKSKNPSLFSILTLPVCNELSESLKIYFKETHLDQSNKYDCSICKKKTVSTHGYEIIQTPGALIIQLSRFNALRNKNNLPVSFNTELILGNKNYDLVGFVCHSGNLECGHYISYGKRKNTWYMFNDSSVLKIDKPPTSFSDAYLLFYAEKSLL